MEWLASRFPAPELTEAQAQAVRTVFAEQVDALERRMRWIWIKAALQMMITFAAIAGVVVSAHTGHKTLAWIFVGTTVVVDRIFENGVHRR